MVEESPRRANAIRGLLYGLAMGAAVGFVVTLIYLAVR